MVKVFKVAFLVFATTVKSHQRVQSGRNANARHLQSELLVFEGRPDEVAQHPSSVLLISPWDVISDPGYPCFVEHVIGKDRSESIKETGDFLMEQRLK